MSNIENLPEVNGMIKTEYVSRIVKDKTGYGWNIEPAKMVLPWNVTDCAGNNLDCLNKDIACGTAKEERVINRLATYFGEDIKKSEYQFSPFDAFSETTKYEIKSRRVRYNAYPTTIIACDKTRTEGRLVFVFHFIDGLYYIVYDPTLFSKYAIQNVSAVRSGGVRTLKPHYYIPIQDLKPIHI